MKNFSVPAVIVILLAAVPFTPFSAKAEDSLARFQGGIGVIPVSSGVGTAATAEVVNRNIVRGVQPAGQIWVIADLTAEVRTDGRINVQGKGLLLGGGNSIGTNAGASVFATLLCVVDPTPPGTFTEHSTDSDPNMPGNQGVPLQANGDFRIDDLLSPAPPNPCVSPVLLIRNAGNRGWFAAGIPDSD